MPHTDSILLLRENLQRVFLHVLNVLYFTEYGFSHYFFLLHTMLLRAT